MSFLDSVKTPSGAAPTKTGGGGFLGSVNIPTPAKQQEAVKINDLTKSASQATKDSNDANSVGGMFKDAVSSIWDTAKSYVTDSAKQAVDFEKNLVTHPVKTYNDVVSGFSDGIIQAASTSFNQGTDAVTQMMIDHQNGTGSTAGDVANLAKLAGAVPGVLFSPVSGAFAGAQKVPILRQVADAINIPFTVTGLAAAYGTGKILDAVPDQYLSQDSKDVLRKPLEDLASLAAQVTIGGKIMDKVGDVVKSGRTVTPAEATRIVTEVHAENPDVFSEQAQQPTPPGFVDNHVTQTRLTHAEYAASQGYEPYTPPEELPVIQTGPAAKSDLPVIQADAPAAKPVKGDLTYEPIPEVLQPVAAKAKDFTSANAFIKALPADVLTPEAAKEIETRANVKNTDSPEVVKTKTDAVMTEIYNREHEPKGTGTEQVSGLAKSVNKDAIKAGLEEGLGQLPVYSRMDMDEQAKLAADLIKKDPEQAMRVAMGDEHSPVPHLLPESVYTAMRIAARDAGDIETLRSLALDSKIVNKGTAMGQAIKALDSGVRDDPVSIMQDVKDAREAKLEKKNKGAIAKEKKAIASDIKVEMKKAVSSRPTWEEFIKEVQCDY